MLDNVIYVPSAHANLISVLQPLNRGAKSEFSKQGASIRNKSDGKNLYTASQYEHTWFQAYGDSTSKVVVGSSLLPSPSSFCLSSALLHRNYIH